MLYGLPAVVRAAFDVLRQDARTGPPVMDWHFGRRSFEGIQRYPAGLVSLGTFADGQVAMAGPGRGRQGTFAVIVRLKCEAQDVGKSEEVMHDLIDRTLAVLAEYRSLNLPNVTSTLVQGEPTNEAEAPPPSVVAALAVVLTMRV